MNATPQTEADPDAIEAATIPLDDVPTAVDDELLTDDERAAMAEGDDTADMVDDNAPGDVPDDAPDSPDLAATPAAAAQPFVMQDFDARLTEIKSQADALQDAWDNGDVSDTDYRTQLAANAKAEALAEVERDQYEKMKAADDKRWNDSVTAYKGANPDLWSDDKTRAAFNQIVGDVTSNPLYAKLTYAQQIERAHARLMEDAPLMGLTNVPPMRRPGTPGALAAQQKQEVEASTRARPTPPATLARLPASDMTSPNDGRFAQLDRVVNEGRDALQSERILSRMSPEELEAYGAGVDL